MPLFLESEADLVTHARGIAVHRTQEISDQFLADLADDRQVFSNHHFRLPDAMRVASIPEALVDAWAAQGFDIWREEASAIVARLRAENLTAFLATNGRV
ncbi:hypothetical protein [Roseomonas sp. WA12]